MNPIEGGDYSNQNNFGGMDFFKRDQDQKKLLEWILARHEDRLLDNFGKRVKEGTVDSIVSLRFDVEGLHFILMQRTRDAEKAALIRNKYKTELKKFLPYIKGDSISRMEYVLILMEWLDEIAELLGLGKSAPFPNIVENIEPILSGKHEVSILDSRQSI